MNLADFILMLRCLHNIDGYRLEPEFSGDAQARFCRDPVRYLLSCDDAHAERIWTELQKRFGRNQGLGYSIFRREDGKLIEEPPPPAALEWDPFEQRFRVHIQEE